MSKKKVASKPRYTLADLETAMEKIAPTALAQSWDNVGLLAGDRRAAVERALLCIDLTAAVADEAIRKKADLVMAYHPPIFRPITALRVPCNGTEDSVFRCLRAGVAVYSPHTALDAADGGTNDVLAGLAGAVRTEPIEYVDRPGRAEFKIVVFVPREVVEKVAGAMFEHGAGRIGEYARCSFRSGGQGTFLGGETTNPAVGERGRLEYVNEIKLETVVPADALPAVVNALRSAHPYEEPAFDIYPLQAKPVRGIGRHGALPKPTTLAKLAKTLKKSTRADHVQIVGSPDREIERVIAVAGAAGSLPFKMRLTASDAILTGEIRHHDALTIERLGCSAVALGHWFSERPVLAPLAEQLRAALPGLDAVLSDADCNPFGGI